MSHIAQRIYIPCRCFGINKRPTNTDASIYCLIITLSLDKVFNQLDSEENLHAYILVI